MPGSADWPDHGRNAPSSLVPSSDEMSAIKRHPRLAALGAVLLAGCCAGAAVAIFVGGRSQGVQPTWIQATPPEVPIVLDSPRRGTKVPSLVYGAQQNAAVRVSGSAAAGQPIRLTAACSPTPCEVRSTADSRGQWSAVMRLKVPAASTALRLRAAYVVGNASNTGSAVDVRLERQQVQYASDVEAASAGLISKAKANSAEPPMSAARRGNVLVVGDSLEVLTSPYLRRYLPGAKLTINAKGGYSSLQIFELFRQSYDPRQNVIVFDAGTNDNPNYPQILRGRLEAVAGIVGRRCMVVPTIHGLSVGGVDSTGKNVVVREFVAGRAGTKSPDWAAAVSSHPELMQSDNLHPIAAGADFRAQLIAAGVRACLAAL